MNLKKWLDISTEITSQKPEKFLSERGNLDCTCLLACQLALCQLRNFLCEFNEKYFAIFDQSRCAICISHDIACSYFLENLLVSFFLWYDFKVLVELKGEGTFLPSIFMSVKHSAELIFLKWKLNILSFIFLIWMEQFWIWFSWKLTNFCCFLNFLLPPLWLSNLGSDLSISNITRPGLADTKVVSQNCCQEGARTHGKVKIPNPQR